jgi:hypothetical protein
MLPRLFNIALLVLLSTQLLSVSAAKRRSRIDLPVKKAAVAPLEDNIATASGSEVITEKLEAPSPSPTTEKEPEAPPPPSEKPEEVSSESESSSELTSSEEANYFNDCDVDNISFELVTGSVYKYRYFSDTYLKR